LIGIDGNNVYEHDSIDSDNHPDDILWDEFHDAFMDDDFEFSELSKRTLAKLLKAPKSEEVFFMAPHQRDDERSGDNDDSWSHHSDDSCLSNETGDYSFYDPQAPSASIAEEVTRIYKTYAGTVESSTWHFRVPLEEIVKDIVLCNEILDLNLPASGTAIMAPSPEIGAKALTLQPPTDQPPLKLDTRQDTIERTSRRVAFTWRERVYDEAGDCHIRYSRWSDMFTKTAVYFRETRYGARLHPAQLASHQKSKTARATHEAMLRLVDEEFIRQRGNSKLTKSQAPPEVRRSIIRNVPRASSFPNSAPIEQAPESQLRVPSFMRVGKRIKRPKSHQVCKPPRSTVRQPSNHTPVHQVPAKTPETHDIQIFGSPTGGASSCFHTSYILASSSQHHAWISPVHRKALRQQPFKIRV
jgi:hypothetical protein